MSFQIYKFYIGKNLAVWLRIHYIEKGAACRTTPFCIEYILNYLEPVYKVRVLIRMSAIRTERIKLLQWSNLAKVPACAKVLIRDHFESKRNSLPRITRGRERTLSTDPI